MTTAWEKMPAEHVQPGDEVRLESGRQLVVTRIEQPFMGRPQMLAFVQDTAEGWFKQPVQSSAVVEARRGP